MIMEFFKHKGSVWILRLSLGVMYLYSGIDLFQHPGSWHWAIPLWLQNVIEGVIALDTYIKLQGLLEIVFALVLLLWFVKKPIVRWVALISAIEFVIILVLAFFPWSATNFAITFRDIGLVGASAALYFLLF